MNIAIYKVTIQIEMPIKKEPTRSLTSVSESLTCQVGSHIVMIDEDIYLKATKDSSCVPLKTYTKFIVMNPGIFQQVNF